MAYQGNNANRRYTPPTPIAQGGRPAAKPVVQATTKAKGMGKGSPADFDIVATDAEFSDVVKTTKEIDGVEREVSMRVGAIWSGLKNKDGSEGAPFVLLGPDGADRITAKLFREDESSDESGATYTLRLTETGDDGKRHHVKGVKGNLGTVWCPTGGLYQFSFTALGTKLTGGASFAVAFHRGKGKQ